MSPRRGGRLRRGSRRARDARTPASGRIPLLTALASRHSSGAEAWFVVALAALVLVGYAPAMVHGGFVWDDIDHIPGESAIREWSGILRIWFQPDAVQEPHYRPLTYTSFWLEHKLWGFAPSGYHTVNVLLHLANTLLLWRILRRLAAPGALLIAAVFAVHPVHVESVAWAIERKDMLSGLGYLSAALVWLHYQEHPRRRTYATALALFAAAVLAKNMVVTLPAALLVLQWYRNGRVTRRDLLLAAPFLAVALCFIALDLTLVSAATPAEFHYSIIERVLIASRAIWFYASTLLWPLDLVVIYPHWDTPLGAPLDWRGTTTAAAWAGASTLAALAATLWLLRERIGRGPLAGLIFFCVTLSPALGLIDHTYMLFSFVADRYQYLASIGPTAVLVGAAAHAGSRLPASWRRGVPALAAGVLLLLATLTWQQSRIYSDQITFFEHITRNSPSAVGAHLNLAIAQKDAGRLDEAREAGRIAVEQRPDEFDAYGNLVQILVASGEPAEALALAREAAARFADEARAHGHVGLALVHLGRTDAATPEFERAVALDPGYADGRLGLGVVRLSQQRHEEALEQLQVVTRLEPGNTQGWTNMGIALLYLGRYSEAVSAFERSLELDPRQEQASAGLAQARERLGEGGR